MILTYALRPLMTDIDIGLRLEQGLQVLGSLTIAGKKRTIPFIFLAIPTQKHVVTYWYLAQNGAFFSVHNTLSLEVAGCYL